PSPYLGHGVIAVFFYRRRRHTSFSRDWSSDVCSSDLSWDRGGERRVMPADESKTAAPRRGAAAAMRDAALVSVAEVTHAGEHHRSEERRVGKECWCRGTSNSYKRATLSSRRNTDDGCV